MSIVRTWKSHKNIHEFLKFFSDRDEQEDESHQKLKIFEEFVRYLDKISTEGIGPMGKMQFFKEGDDDVVITNCCEVFMKKMNFNKWMKSKDDSNSLIETVVKSYGNFNDMCGDGGYSMLVLLTNLLENGRGYSENSEINMFCWVLENCMEWMNNFLFANAEKNFGRIFIKKVDPFGGIDILMKVVDSVILCSSVVRFRNETEKVHFSLQVVKAYLKSLPDDEKLTKKFAPKIRIEKLLNSKIKNSLIINGMLMPSSFSSSVQNMTRKKKEFNLILYEIPLEFESFINNRDHNLKFKVEMNKCSGDFVDKYSKRIVEELLQKFVEIGVDIVACQKTVHPYVKEVLFKNDIIIVETLSIFHVGDVKRISGATPLRTFSKDINKEYLGKVKGIKEVLIDGKEFIVLEGCEGRVESIVTLLISSPSKYVFEELKKLTERSFKILNKFVFYPYVVPNGGCFELFLSFFFKEVAKYYIKIGKGMFS